MSFIDARIHTHTPTPSRSPLPLPIVLHLAEVHTCVLPLLFYFSLPYTLRLVIPTAGIYQVYIRLTRQKSTQTHICIYSLSKTLYIYGTNTRSPSFSLLCPLLPVFKKRGQCCQKGLQPRGTVANASGGRLQAGRRMLAGFSSSLSRDRTLLQLLKLLCFS